MVSPLEKHPEILEKIGLFVVLFNLIDGRLNLEFYYLLDQKNKREEADLYPKKWTRKCPLFDSVKLLSYEQKNIHKGTDKWNVEKHKCIVLFGKIYHLYKGL